MKYLILAVSFCVNFMSNMAYGSDESSQLSLERAARIVAASYASGNPSENLFEDDQAYKPLHLSEIISSDIKIDIGLEHSLEEEPGEKSFVQGFTEYSGWLEEVRSSFRFPDNLRVRTLGSCKSGCCNFPLTYGISHNTLYLTQACFVVRDNNLYLKSITMLDGD